MDRVKAQANQLAQMTQEAAQEGRARIDQAQAGRRGDALLRQLGALVLADRTGRGQADGQAKIDQLITDISAYEQQAGVDLTAPPPSSPFGQPGGQGPAGQGPAGQGPAGQGPAGQGPAGQGQAGQPASPQPGYPGGGPAPQGGGSDFPGGQPPPGWGDIPPVDTGTSFFPAPDDDTGPSGYPQG
jgi:hypothetical protein